MEKTLSEFAVRILPEGGAVFLYSDKTPLRDLGDMTLQRASNVEWDEEAQKWVILFEDRMTGVRVQHPEKFDQRSDAIAEEISILNGMLASGLPAEKLFHKSQDTIP